MHGAPDSRRTMTAGARDPPNHLCGVTDMDSDDRRWPNIRRRVTTVSMIIVIGAASTPFAAQWFNYPSPRAPRTANGDVDLAAAAPRLATGQPDLSGVWMTAEPACVIRGTVPLSELRTLLPPSRTCPPRTASFSRHSIN